jgi:sulfonate transport system substrate-binding protein
MRRHQYRLRLDASILSSLKKTAIFLKNQHIITQVPDFKQAANPDFLEDTSKGKSSD